MSGDFRCLAIETSTSHCSVAATDGLEVAQRETDGAPDQSRVIFNLVRESLNELNLELNALQCIALGIGPGSFTGLRVGAAAAQGLAFGADLPVCRVSSLAALAQCIDTAESRLVVCVDARMGEAYVGDYRRGVGGHAEASQPDALIEPSSWSATGHERFVAAGAGWQAHPQLLERHASRVVEQYTGARPTAAGVLKLARGRYASGEVVSPAAAVPNYLRNTVTG